MDGLKTRLIILLLATFSILAAAPDARAKVRFEPRENMEATEQELEEIGAFFDGIEDALMKEDLDRIMTYYSDNYFHLGLKKDEVRGIWKDLFAKYDKLHSIHVFSRVVVVDDEGLVVCTGTLLGVPAGAGGKRFVTVDSWAEQNHYIYKVGGSWKITGGSSHRMNKGKSAGKRPLGFHPLY